MQTKTHKQTHSELRQDLVTGDWVIIATGRAKRPEDFIARESSNFETSRVACVFDDPEHSGQEPDVLMYRTQNGDWTLRVFSNKFPAVSRGRAPRSLEQGPYFGMTGTGYHEVIVTRDHDRSMALLDPAAVAEVADAYQERYLSLMNKKNVRYISIIHNHGKSAGASIAHPHSQLFAIPVVSPYVQMELSGSEKYFKSNHACVYCTMVSYEVKRKERVVFENADFVAFCPYASRAAFEVWVAPKKHSPYFERISDASKILFGEALQRSLHALYEGLANPDYNFYVHTAPCDGKDYPHFHWHVEILPKTSVWAGFELSTGIEISTIQPEIAANHLRDCSA